MQVDLYEYQARNLFDAYGVPVLPGIVVETPEEAQKAAEKLAHPLMVVKAQVKTVGAERLAGLNLLTPLRRRVKKPKKSWG